ncbi:hypothetical protein FBU59_000983 [Linderina macrospora]|uniref:Uncharacterized protein n=1 Tax=Linderina macrospora TaxID=4868 RepID=A0ACC1JF64_9FUNG|nr:hypothetical protein FBU59_000983 [Linderina macrospora]
MDNPDALDTELAAILLYSNQQECAAEFAGICGHDDMDVMRRKIEAACKKAKHETSTIEDYAPYIKFFKHHSIYNMFIPSFMVGAPLILDCRVECPCTDNSCPKSHERVWLSNYNELKAADMLPLVDELRIIIYNESPKDLNLNMAILELKIPHGAIPKIKLIKFLGQGLFLAGEYKDMADANIKSEVYAEAVHTAKLIIGLCPKATELWFHEHRDWGTSEGLLQDIPGVGSAIMLALRRVLYSNLTTMQIARPFTDDVIQLFSPDLQRLSVDFSVISELTRLPPIPTDNVRHLALTRISRDIDWGIFQSGPDGKAHFPKLETLVLKFDKPEGRLAYTSWYRASVAFPTTVVVVVGGVNDSRGTLLNLFKENSCGKLVLVEHPSFLQKFEIGNLKCSRKVEVRLCPSPDDQNHLLPTNGLWQFYGCRSGVKEMSISGMEVVMPAAVCWNSVEVLDITVGIADYEGLLNLVFRLKRLRTLKIKCFSMDRSDLYNPGRGVHFAGESEQHSIIDAHVSNEPKKFRKKLTSLHIYSQQGIVLKVIRKLVLRISTIAEVFVNSEAVDSVSKVVSDCNVKVGAVDPDVM